MTHVRTCPPAHLLRCTMPQAVEKSGALASTLAATAATAADNKAKATAGSKDD